MDSWFTTEDGDFSIAMLVCQRGFSTNKNHWEFTTCSIWDAKTRIPGSSDSELLPFCCGYITQHDTTMRAPIHDSNKLANVTPISLWIAALMYKYRYPLVIKHGNGKRTIYRWFSCHRGLIFHSHVAISRPWKGIYAKNATLTMILSHSQMLHGAGRLIYETGSLMGECR